MTIEQEIAELMGRDRWFRHVPKMFSPDVVYDEAPDLSDHCHLGIIEWWCRDRGVWILFDEGVYKVYRPDAPAAESMHRKFTKALLAAVRLAAKEE